MAETSDGKMNGCDNKDVFNLNDFCECFDLPRWVEIIGGCDLGAAKRAACNIEKGMIILLRTLAVDNVTLSFNDAEAGKRIIHVSPNTQVKFNVLLPYPDYKDPEKPRSVFKTVADLLKACPTYFKANLSSDSHNQSSSIKSGEIYRFISQIRTPNDRKVYLQCKDPDGNILDLPETLEGNFTAEEDHNTYTLKEILDLGQVDRKLRLSKEHISLSLVADPNYSYILFALHILSDICIFNKNIK